MMFDDCHTPQKTTVRAATGTGPKTALSEAEFVLFRDYIEKYSGIRLKDNKSHMLQMRLTGLMQETGSDSYATLYQKIKQDTSSELREQLVEVMTTNETHWFRDQSPYKILKNVLFPEFAVRIKKGMQTSIKVWSAACSTGQEPYTIAMVFLDFLRTHPALGQPKINILATDISQQALQVAHSGQYDRLSMSRGLPAHFQDTYFKPKEKWYQILPEVQRLVRFKHFNLKSPYHMIGKQDIVFCRNVLCYFDQALKKDIVTRIAQLLRPNGYLFVGAIESMISYSLDYKMLRKQQGIYYQVEERPAPTMQRSNISTS